MPRLEHKQAQHTVYLSIEGSMLCTTGGTTDMSCSRHSTTVLQSMIWTTACCMHVNHCVVCAAQGTPHLLEAWHTWGCLVSQACWLPANLWRPQHNFAVTAGA
jgi:hypothetical protein